MEENIINYISDKLLASRICKEHIQPNNKKTIQIKNKNMQKS